MEPQKVALIDLDDTMVALSDRIREEIDKIAHKDELTLDKYSRDSSLFNRRWQLIKSQPNFWSTLPPIKTGFAVYNEIRAAGFATHVLTHCPRKTYSAWAGKAQWCDVNLPNVDITITRNKSLTHAALLFDDWPEYMQTWLDAQRRSYGIMLAHPHNTGFQHPRVYKVFSRTFESDLPQLRNFLTHVRDCEESHCL